MLETIFFSSLFHMLHLYFYDDGFRARKEDSIQNSKNGIKKTQWNPNNKTANILRFAYLNFIRMFVFWIYALLLLPFPGFLIFFSLTKSIERIFSKQKNIEKSRLGTHFSPWTRSIQSFLLFSSNYRIWYDFIRTRYSICPDEFIVVVFFPFNRSLPLSLVRYFLPTNNKKHKYWNKKKLNDGEEKEQNRKKKYWWWWRILSPLHFVRW